MAFVNGVYTLYVENNDGTSKHFISFRDSTGALQVLEVLEAFYIEFRQLERRNRNLIQSEWRHNEHSKPTEQTLHKRAMVYPKSVEDVVVETEQAKFLRRAIDKLPDIQRRRFLLYYEYDLNYYEIGVKEHCTAQSAR